MPLQLFIRLSSTPDEAETVAVDDEGRVVERRETASLAAAAEKAERYQLVTVLLPGQELVTTLADVPAAGAARVRQMLPYSLEDDFAADVEDLHFAAGPRNADDLMAVSVIAKERLELWLEVLKTAGIRPRQICAETDAVPDTPGVVTLFLEGRKIMGRRPSGAPFLFEDLDLSDLWRLLEAERADASDLAAALLMLDSATATARRREIDEWRANVERVDIKELPDGCLPRLAASLAARPGTNLLQGVYAARSNLRALAAPWRVAAAFLIAFVGLGVVAQGAVYFKLRRDEVALDRQIGAICAQDFGIQQLARCRADMQRRLNQAGQSASGGDEGYLAALDAIARHAGDGFEIERIDYRNDVTTLEVLASSIPELDAFDRRMTETGRFSVEIISTRGENGAIWSRLQITSAGS